ncbi:hypothetical protein [Caproicibacter sp.]|uniref:hypothetical protein n=1 Tax=Caproicibacter sp. TaxID=2814884 RepID=UPI00398A43C9
MQTVFQNIRALALQNNQNVWTVLIKVAVLLAMVAFLFQFYQYKARQKPLRYPKLRAAGHFLSFLVDVYLAIVLSLSQFIGLTLFILASYAYSIYYKPPEAKH